MVKLVLADFLKRDDINYGVGKKIDALMVSGVSTPENSPNGNPLQASSYDGVVNDIIDIVAKFNKDEGFPDQIKQQFHNPNLVYGKWKLVLVVQNHQKLPIQGEEYMAFSNNQLMQIFQNNVQINSGGFYFNHEYLTIHFMNGIIDTRAFRCYQRNLYIIQYVNYVPFRVNCYQRAG